MTAQQHRSATGTRQGESPPLLPTVSRRRAAIANLVFNYARVMLTIASGIILVPLYLRYFDLATYGAWLASGNVLALLGIIEAGTNLVFAQRLASAYGHRDGPLFSQVAGAGLVITLAITTVLIALALALAPSVPGWVGITTSQSGLLTLGFAWAGIGSGLTIYTLMLSAIATSRNRTVFAGSVSTLSTLLGILATLWGLLGGLGVASLGLGVMVRGTTGGAMLTGYIVWLWRIERLPKIRPDRQTMRELLILTLPVSISKIGGTVLQNTQAILVAVLIDPSVAAILVLTGRLYDVGIMFLTPIGSSVFAGIAHLAAVAPIQQLRQIVREVLALFSALAAIVFAVAMSIDASFVTLWVGPDRFGGTPLAVMICFAGIVTTRCNIVQTLLTSLGEIGKTAWLSTAEMVVRVPLLYVCIRKFGLIGCPIAEATSAILVNVWPMSRLLARRLQLTRSESLVLSVEGIAPLIAAFAIGVAILSMPLSPATDVLRLTSRVVVYGTMIGATVCLFSPVGRGYLVLASGRAFAVLRRSR